MNIPTLLPGLGATLRCSIAPWTSPTVFKTYDQATADGAGKDYLVLGMLLYFGAGFMRHVAFGAVDPLMLLLMMTAVVSVPLLISYPAALIVGGVSAAIDGILLCVNLVGFHVPNIVDGGWQLAASAVSLLFGYIYRRRQRASTLS